MTEKEIAKEEYYANDIINVLKTSLQNDYGRFKFQRRFHAKSLGLLEAEFKIAANLPENLKVGLFKASRTYRALVRFSNAAEIKGDDAKKGVRGMSIKVLDVDEKPIEFDALGNTQDILLTNNKIIFPGTVKMQRFAIRALFTSKFYYTYIFFSFNFTGLVSFIKGVFSKIPHVLECCYFSATPYMFGEGQAVKWKANPLKPINSKMPDNPDKDFLRQRLTDDLSNREFDFELCIQLQQDPKKEPVEDSAVEWKASFIKVAIITILQQDFNTAERKKSEDTIVFSPWHSMQAHQPLGGINRIRRRIYRQFSECRKQHNENAVC